MGGKFTAATVRALRHSGTTTRTERHPDGAGLYLQCAPGRSRVWVLRYQRHGRERWMGLGSADHVSLAEARRLAAEARAMVRRGLDPIDQRRQEAALRAASGRSFADAVQRYLEAHATSWRNPKHRQQWENTLATTVAAFGTVPAAEVTTDHVLGVLRPIWTRTPETASRLRGRIERVLDWAAAAGWRTGDNPARWRGHLAHHLPPPKRVRPVQHHPALAWQRMGAFWTALAARASVSAEALRFCILTAARSGEVRGMRWREVDWDARVWTVPPERMKAKRAHRVPLSAATLEVLRRMQALTGGAPEVLVFPSGKRGVPLSDMALSAVLRDLPGGWRDALGNTITVHGFRSTFRDWCGETQAASRDVAEMALAHTIRDATERAYARGDLIEPRRVLMERWARHVTGSAGAVLPLKARAKPWR